MAGDGIRVRIRIEGIRETLAATRRLGPDADAELRDRTRAITDRLAAQLRGDAASDSRQSALIVPTIKARRDRVPIIQAGGSRRVGRRNGAWPRGTASDLLFGAEFGSNRRSGWYARPRYNGGSGRQFRPHQGAGSYWFFRRIDAEQPRIEREWNAIADDVIRRWGGRA